MKIYIAGHDQFNAQMLAKRLAENGYEIVSSWVYGVFASTESFDENERKRIATTCVNEVSSCDLLVLLDSPDKVPGGKFVEVGIALGMGKRVALCGRRENMLMWLPEIEKYGSSLDFEQVFCPDTGL